MKFTYDTLKQTKICIIGMQGSGKTTLAKKIVRTFKKPLVYGVYPEEWIHEPQKIRIYIPPSFTPEAFEEFARILIAEQVNYKTFDCLLIDDADLFFNSNFSRYPSTNRLFISQRQLGLSLIFVSKRPQNLSTKIYENSDYIFIFAIEGVNVKKYVYNLHEEMKNLVPQLSRKNHLFIIKEIGKPPLISKVEEGGIKK